MKIFTQESVIQEVSQNMESNLIKNAFQEDNSEEAMRVKALEMLVEAAEQFERSGNTKKANSLTNVIKTISDEGNKRDVEIQSSIASLEESVNELEALYDSSPDESNNHLLRSAANKITGIVSKLVPATSDTVQSIQQLKKSYKNTPKTLSLISEAAGIADGTIKAIGGKKKDQ